MAKAGDMSALSLADSLCVSEVTFSAACLEGLDEPVEICCITEADATSVHPWGTFWQGFLEDALPGSIDPDSIPSEGGLLFRPLRAFSSLEWRMDPITRRLRVPTRGVHAHLGHQDPKLVGNDIFIELRYSMPPSLVASFDYDDLRDGIFRAFAIPVRLGGSAPLPSPQHVIRCSSGHTNLLIFS